MEINSGVDRELDIIIFGASGYTGKFVVAEAVQALSKSTEGSKAIKWGVAGRSRAKLEATLKEAVALEAGNSSPPVADISIILADVNDEGSLQEMCKRTKLVLNCVGPFRTLGEPVVKACIKVSTDYLDVCGEPEFLERVELKYHEEAKKNGCVIVGACAFDSVPADFGVQFARKQFLPNGMMTGVDTFLSIDAPKGYSGHVTTYECAVAGIGNQEELKAIRKAAAKDKPVVDKSGKKPELKRGPFEDPRLPGESCFLFPGADASVIRRTEEQFSATVPDYKSFYHSCYFHVSSWSGYAKMIVFGGLFQSLAQFGWGRRALLKYPELFSCGSFSSAGSRMEQLKAATFNFHIFAEGSSDSSTVLPDKEVRVCVKGPDPGYIGTSRILVQLALCAILERSQMPSGGVFTPGFAFSKCSAVDRLSTRGVTFCVV